MAIRIHVVGAYGATAAEFRNALDAIGDEGIGSQRFRLGSSGRWVWANASVWDVGGSEIDDALSALSVPALRVTSSDAVLWMMTLTAPLRDRFYGVHHFTQVGAEPPELDQDDGSVDADFPDDELEEVAGINRYIPELEFLWDAEEEAHLMEQYRIEQAATVEGLEDYVDYGASLPATAIEEMQRHPHRACYTAFMAHGPQITQALEEFGFEFDRSSMLDLLTVGPLTDTESESDIGNLPRFLHALGIDGVFREASLVDGDPPVSEKPPDEIEQLIEEDQADQNDGSPDWSKYPPGELFATMEPLVADCQLTDIAGGPLVIKHVALLHLLAHLCSENQICQVALEFPNETVQPARSWTELPDFEVKRRGSQWSICFDTPPYWWFDIDDCEDIASHEFAEALGTLSVGTRIELTFVVKGLAERCHRYAGVYRGGGLELERVYPEVTVAVLTDALELINQIFESQAITFASKQEENVVRGNYQRSEGEVPRIRNGKILPERGSRSVVVQTLLFERFEGRGPWDIAAARRLIEDDWDLFEQITNLDDEGDDHDDYDDEDYDDEDDDYDDETFDEVFDDADADEQVPFHRMFREMSEAVERSNQEKVVPHDDEVVYQGRTGHFFRASMALLPHVSPDLLADHDATMADLGLRPIGDFVGDADQRQEITRCYAGHRCAIALHSQRNENNQLGWADVSDGLVMVDFSRGCVEFHTHFEDGTTLVTTSIDAATSNPVVGVYVRAYEDATIGKLWEKHQDAIGRFKEHRDAVPINHEGFGELTRFLALMDELFCRFMGLE